MSARPRVFVTRRLPGSALERLAQHCELAIWGDKGAGDKGVGDEGLEGTGAPPPQALAAGSRDADGLLCLLTDPIDAALLAACPRLRVISSCSVGVDHIDLDAARARGIPVGHTPGVLVETTADLAFGLLLAAARRIVEADRYVREGRWSFEHRWDPEALLGRDVHGATLGIVGLGAVGQALARRASGFGMRVLGWSRSTRLVPGVEACSLEALLAEAEFVSVHVALTPETRGLLSAGAIAAMRPGAILINTARGGIVDEAALAAALRTGRLAAAALDVFAREPLDPASPLLAAPNLLLTPHIGSASIATRTRMADLAVENLLAGLAGRPLLHRAG